MFGFVIQKIRQIQRVLQIRCFKNTFSLWFYQISVLFLTQKNDQAQRVFQLSYFKNFFSNRLVLSYVDGQMLIKKSNICINTTPILKL